MNMNIPNSRPEIGWPGRIVLARFSIEPIGCYGPYHLFRTRGVAFAIRSFSKHSIRALFLDETALRFLFPSSRRQGDWDLERAVHGLIAAAGRAGRCDPRAYGFARTGEIGRERLSPLTSKERATIARRDGPDFFLVTEGKSFVY